MAEGRLAPLRLPVLIVADVLSHEGRRDAWRASSAPTGRSAAPGFGGRYASSLGPPNVNALTLHRLSALPE
jgi:hypothetical protein